MNYFHYIEGYQYCEFDLKKIKEWIKNIDCRDLSILVRDEFLSDKAILINGYSILDAMNFFDFLNNEFDYSFEYKYEIKN